METNIQSETMQSLPAPSSQTVQAKVGWGVPIVFLLLLIMVGIFSFIAYWGWNQLNNLQVEQIELKQTLSFQKSQNDHLNEKLLQASVGNKKIHQQIDVLERALKDEQFRIEKLSEQITRVSSNDEVDWQLAQLEYYTLLAHKRLKLTHDLPGAMALLDESITIAKEIEEPQALAILQALESDKTILATTVDVNVEHVFIQIDEMIKQIGQLTMPEVKWDWGKSKTFEKQEETGAKDKPVHFSDVQGWNGHVDLALERMAKFFSESLVRTQTLDKPIKPLLPPEQRVYLQQNLQLILEQAQLAALRRQGGNYSASLHQANRWLDDYFRADTAVAGYMKKTINELINLNINPQIPEISNSIDAVKVFSKQWLSTKQKRQLKMQAPDKSTINEQARNREKANNKRGATTA